MIVYKSAEGNWRIPTSIVKNVGGTWQNADTIRRNNGLGWDINWHRNSSAFSPVGSLHPFWQYSMNPTFNISENNFFGLYGMYELSFDTALGGPDQNCRYTAGAGELNVYLTQKFSNNFADGIIRSKWPLNVPSGSRYRSRVVISSRTPANETFGVMPCRFYRLVIDGVRDGAVANSVQLAEFRLFDINGNNLSPTYSGTGSYPAGEGPDKAGDGSTSTKWLDFTETGSVLNMTFASNTTIGGYRLTTANDAPERDPASWRLQASTNNSTWVTISTITSAPSTNRLSLEPDYFLQPTILTGFWSAPTYAGADFKGDGSATHWGARIDIGRTTSFNEVGTGFETNYFNSTKTLTHDVTFPSGNIWARPLIKIASESTNALPVSYKITQWDITRLS
jgi:hypothetical protein